MSHREWYRSSGRQSGRGANQSGRGVVGPPIMTQVGRNPGAAWSDHNKQFMTNGLLIFQAL